MQLPISCLGHITYLAGSPEALARSEAVAAEIAHAAACGLGPGQTAILCESASTRFFTRLFAIWSLGGAAACLDTALTPAERERVGRFVKAQFAYGDGFETFPGAATTDHIHSLDDPALILFTSGTTGEPKGVVHSFRSILARIACNIAATDFNAQDTALLTLPVHFGHGLIGNGLTPLFAGAHLVIPPTGLALAQALGPTIDAHGITFMSSVPALWRMALKLSPRPSNGTLRRVHIGSAPLAVDLIRHVEDWAQCEVFNSYGITETANWIGAASSRDPLLRDGFVGRPWAGHAGVIDAAGQFHHHGEGEIAVLTPSLMQGYLHRDDLTRAAFHKGWYRTGDWGTVDKAGNICLSGRVKDEINRAGFKVQPAEIDMLLESHPAIAEACCFGIPDEIGSEIVAAAVALRPNATATPEELRHWCLARLRRNAVPERWFIVDGIPKTSRGKLKRDEVRRLLMEAAP